MHIEISDKRWSLREIRNKVRRRTGYFKRQYLKQYPDIKDVVYIRIPKTGSTSLVNVLKGQGLLYLNNEKAINFYFPQKGFVSFGPLSYEYLLNKGMISQSYHENMHVFTTVRNPFARTVSTFFYYKKIGWLNQNMSFDAYTDYIKRIELNELDNFYDSFRGHIFPQYKFLFCNGERFVHHTMRLESINTDIRELESMMNFNLHLPHLNKSVFEDYRNLYSSQSISNVLSVYEKDFELLGYSKEL
ncbi:sulfotransferase family 2 domain-containing protein [Carboxylicivirga marina]|uniref:Sulfotransferase family 2 domain-containing protein n=1 Tax=Carboxylicivirga marina TaxID=2800988 RepID=A0ABS1HMB6_9BACT|nr:sulfotransferase family 2 domain-containing protein [Carboxylicivirga marina]MBK3518813.1 sulfotransferase family 2 domain-containing protein [Carboxylicivirga marina]